MWAEYDDRVLLEKRPPSGIWGGLYSLPELTGSDPMAFCQLLGLRPAGAAQALPPLLHSFTHFTLSAIPWRVDASTQALHDGDRYLWLARPELTAAPLPAPIRRLLLEPQASLC